MAYAEDVGCASRTSRVSPSWDALVEAPVDTPVEKLGRTWRDEPAMAGRAQVQILGRDLLPGRTRRAARTVTDEDILDVPLTPSRFDARVRARLDDIAARLKKARYDKVVITAGTSDNASLVNRGHASRARGHALRGYLISRGLDGQRIQVRVAFRGDQDVDALWYARHAGVQVSIAWSPPTSFSVVMDDALASRPGARRYA